MKSQNQQALVLPTGVKLARFNRVPVVAKPDFWPVPILLTDFLAWVALAMIVGLGSWLMITGFVARSTGKFPNSVLMSGLAVPYFGYPAWAFWLGCLLLGW